MAMVENNDVLLEKYLSELEYLVSIDSGTYTVDGIRTVAAFFEKRYKALGFTTTMHDLGSAGVGFEARNKPEAEHIDVLFIGHMDTVFPVGTAKERPFSYKDGKAYGPGVSDMKSGLLSLLYALESMDPKKRATLSLCIAQNPDEEVGSVHSTAWLTELAKKSRYALVMESARANGDLVKARKGSVTYRIVFHGKAAHAGNAPQDGRSAIVEMAHWILETTKMQDLTKGISCNAGVVQGGSAANVVPESAVLEVDIRFWDNAVYTHYDEKIRTMAEKPFTNDITIEVEQKSYKPAMTPTESTEQLMHIVSTVGKELGIDFGYQSVGGGSDANLTAFYGVPSLDGLGPVGGNFHSKEEYLDCTSIIKRIQLVQHVVERLA